MGKGGKGKRRSRQQATGNTNTNNENSNALVERRNKEDKCRHSGTKILALLKVAVADAEHLSAPVDHRL
jgi:hypothetical protein